MSSGSTPPRVSVVGDVEGRYASAVTGAGGEIVGLGPATEALIWGAHGDAVGLKRVITAAPNLRWVQLPSAGVDGFFTAGVVTPRYVWTSAKGAFARPVAEHALALTLALLRRLHTRARSRAWGEQAGTSMFGLTVLIIGGGGIAREFARLVQPFGVEVRVSRRAASPVPFAALTFTPEDLPSHLPVADIVVVAAPLTPDTQGLMDSSAFRMMKKTSILVNVARGGLVVTDDLVAALREGLIAGAALDVTDPEPLPTGHPLWSQPAALITPHSADTPEMIVPLLANRIADNVGRFARGDELVGLIDMTQQY